MSVTDGMITGIPEIRRPEVMDHRPPKRGQKFRDHVIQSGQEGNRTVLPPVQVFVLKEITFHFFPDCVPPRSIRGGSRGARAGGESCG